MVDSGTPNRTRRTTFERHLQTMTPRLTIAAVVKASNAVVLQAQRLLGHARQLAAHGFDTAVPRRNYEDQIDAEFMILALHQLWLALQWKRDERRELWPLRIVKQLDRAAGSLQRDLMPDSMMRDVVTHYDAYLGGTGGRPLPGAKQGNCTARISANLTTSPDDPNFYAAGLTVTVISVDADDDQLATTHVDAHDLVAWIGRFISPLIDDMVKVERTYSYDSNGPPTFNPSAPR